MPANVSFSVVSVSRPGALIFLLWLESEINSNPPESYGRGSSWVIGVIVPLLAASRVFCPLVQATDGCIIRCSNSYRSAATSQMVELWLVKAVLRQVSRPLSLLSTWKTVLWIDSYGFCHFRLLSVLCIEHLVTGVMPVSVNVNGTLAQVLRKMPFQRENSSSRCSLISIQIQTRSSTRISRRRQVRSRCFHFC